jgi:hypothetical protein
MSFALGHLGSLSTRMGTHQPSGLVQWAGVHVSVCFGGIHPVTADSESGRPADAKVLKRQHQQAVRQTPEKRVWCTVVIGV